VLPEVTVELQVSVETVSPSAKARASRALSLTTTSKTVPYIMAKTLEILFLNWFSSFIFSLDQ
jgi:hypothetical protein